MLKNKIIYFLLFLLTIIGFVKRIEFGRFVLTVDIGRDLIIAENFFSEINSSFLIRPLSSLKEIPNTPFYFWFISFLYFLTKSYYGVLIVHSLLQTSLIITSFFIMKVFCNKKIAFMTSFFITFSPYFVNNSMEVSQYSLLPLFISLSFLFLVLAIKIKKNYFKNIFLSIISFLPALLLHNSSIPLFFGFSMIWIYLSMKKNDFHELFPVVFLIFFSIATWFLLAYQFEFFLLKDLFEKVFVINRSSNLFLIERFSNSLISLWKESGQPIINLLIVAFSLTFFLVKKKSNGLYILFLPLLSFFISILVPVENWWTSYILAPFLIILVYLFSFLASFIREKEQKIAIFFMMFFFLFHNRQEIIEFDLSSDPFSTLKSIGGIISKNSLNIKQNKKINIILPSSNNSSDLSNWFAPSVLLFLEPKKQFSFSLVDSSIAPNNMSFNTKNEKDLLICVINHEENSLFSTEDCLKDWRLSNSSSRLAKIGQFESDSRQYYIFEEK